MEKIEEEIAPSVKVYCWKLGCLNLEPGDAFMVDGEGIYTCIETEDLSKGVNDII